MADVAAIPQRVGVRSCRCPLVGWIAPVILGRPARPTTTQLTSRTSASADADRLATVDLRERSTTVRWSQSTCASADLPRARRARRRGPPLGCIGDAAGAIRSTFRRGSGCAIDDGRRVEPDAHEDHRAVDRRHRGAGPPAPQGARPRPADRLRGRGGHRHRHLRADRRGGRGEGRPGCGAVVRLRRLRLRAGRALLRGVRQHGAGGGVGVHVLLREPRASSSPGSSAGT